MVIVAGMVFVMRTFLSFGFLSFDIVSNFVFRYSNFQAVKDNNDVGPLGAFLILPVLLVVDD